MRKTPKLTRAEQKQLRPIQILDAAFEEFTTNGYAATRVEDIAERVGVTKGTVYVYFETKELLFEAMIRHISMPFAELSAEPKTSGDAAEDLEALIRKLYTYFYEDRRNREVIRLVIAEGHKFPDIIERHEQEFIDPLVGRINSLLVQGVAAGQFRSRPAQFAELVAAPVITLTVLKLIFGDRRSIDTQAYLEAHLDMLLHGLQGMPPGETIRD